VSEPGHIGKDHYDSSDYFEGERARHLADPDSAFQRYRIEKVTELAAPRPGDRVVDLGCGWGTFELALADRVAEVVGVDFSPAGLCAALRARPPRWRGCTGGARLRPPPPR
jgi:cyclopropane fatty-acyl-phospholipid synthase-like methyltransferase